MTQYKKVEVSGSSELSAAAVTKGLDEILGPRATVEKPIGKCKGVYGWLFGHDFRPVFDEQTEPSTYIVPEQAFPFKYGSEEFILNFKQQHHAHTVRLAELYQKKSRTFVCDVCTRCGQIVQRPVSTNKEETVTNA